LENDIRGSLFQPFAAKARAYGWELAEVNTGHDCYVERPAEVAEILLARQECREKKWRATLTHR
jgi:hypothetical protein